MALGGNEKDEGVNGTIFETVCNRKPSNLPLQQPMGNNSKKQSPKLH
jgi:hypothetical protein